MQGLNPRGDRDRGRAEVRNRDPDLDRRLEDRPGSRILSVPVLALILHVTLTNVR